jgi:hypothetical protein
MNTMSPKIPPTTLDFERAPGPTIDRNPPTPTEGVTMQKRELGTQGLEVSAIGLGRMGMSAFYGDPADEAEAIATIHRALEIGVTLLDTAEMYGPNTNEKLLGRHSPAGATRRSSRRSSASIWKPTTIGSSTAVPSA